MKNILNKYFLVFLFVLCTQTIFSQDIILSNEYKKGVVEKLSMLLNDYYIYPDVAQKTSDHLNAQYEAGYFNKFNDNQTFAKALTESVQSISKDKHMRIMASQPFKAPENSVERKVEQRMDQINNYRSFNHGFQEVKILEGNVAYLDLRGFAGIERAKDIADAYMKLISQSDAVIIDLTKNGGGDPFMVQYLCSYFFNEKLHLNSLYYREGDRTEEFWTLDEVNGKKMGDVPLFVMISQETFSGAEEFAYNMQTQKRAMLIGQTSGGGANPGGTRGINEQLSVFVPTGRAINPITNTSWEGIGVVPEIETRQEETFDQVLILAKKVAETQRINRTDKYTHLYKDLNQHLLQYKKGQSETAISNSITNFVDSGLFGEWDINILGYEYLTMNKSKLALCIFKTNTILFPNSPNVHDSYGEALKVNGDFDASVKSYQKAVDVATEMNDRGLDYYKEALKKVKAEIEKNK